MGANDFVFFFFFFVRDENVIFMRPAGDEPFWPFVLKKYRFGRG